MGLERVALFGTIDLDMQASAGGVLYLSTDLPGNALAIRETKPTPVCSRRIVRLRLSGTTKGHLYAIKFVPYGQARLYGGRIRARELPDGQWQWFPLPLPEVSEWAPVKFEIPPPGEWEPVKLDIPEPGEWAPVKLDIPPPGEWERTALLIEPTAPLPEWVRVPVDA